MSRARNRPSLAAGHARTPGTGAPGAGAEARPGWCVYLLRCRDGSLYAGSTNDLSRRLRRHGAGQGARYTRSRLPVKLVYREPARDQGAALRREAALKRLTRAEKLALVGGRRRVRSRRRPRA